MRNTNRMLKRFFAQTAAQRRAQAEREARERAAYEAAHPILSGKVPLVEYVAPRWSYTPAIVTR